MILLLGKHDVLMEYANNALKIDSDLDVFCCPAATDHHTEFGKYIDVIAEEKPEIITTQNLEMLDVLLESNLEFDVVRTRKYGDEIRTAKMTKKEVNDCREVWNFDPRN